MTAPPALLVTGEAGVGKSRLVTEAAEAAGAHCTKCRCSRYHETTSLYAFRPVLEEACDIAEHDDPAARLSKLRARLGALDANGADLPFLTAALQIPSSDIVARPDVDPTRLRQLALDAAVQLVCAHLEGGPSILFVDDVHWADQSTLDLISALLLTPHPGLVVMLAARDEFDPPWPAISFERLQLAPLTGDELEEMAGLMPEASRLSAEERDALIERCDGMPLFLEELVRTAEDLDQGRVAFHSINYADFRIPPALRDPLLARLTSRGVDLELAQAVASIGREAERDLLQRVTGLSQPELDRKLQSLIDADLVHPHGDDAVRFRHELIREVAYETQGLAARREYHGRIADELLRSGVPSVRSDAWEAAFHLERAGATPRRSRPASVPPSATRSSAPTPRRSRSSRGRSTSSCTSRGPEREHTELMVRELRSFSAVMAAGYAAPEAAEDHGRCVELCEGFGLPPELLPSLIRSWSFYAFRARSPTPSASATRWSRWPAPLRWPSRPKRSAGASRSSSAATSARPAA
jgi:predicted ATPase